MLNTNAKPCRKDNAVADGNFKDIFTNVTWTFYFQATVKYLYPGKCHEIFSIRIIFYFDNAFS